MTDQIVITFANAEMAQCPVAGLPACVRAILLAPSRGCGGNGPILLAVPGGRLDDPFCQRELDRVCPRGYLLLDRADLKADDRCVAGEAILIPALASGVDPALPEGTPASLREFYHVHSGPRLRQELRRADWDFVKATGKPADGVVSRTINRHISMRISHCLLQLSWMRPGHATMLTAIVAMAMLAALLTGTSAGLVAGAALFQLASIVDGVDGEIARVTHRSSALGATLDTITDGLTNVGFIAGLAINLAMRQEHLALETGLAGAGCLALGCVILAASALRHGQPVTFDAVGDWLKRQPGSMQNALIAITKRDFFALASLGLVLLSFDRELLLLLSASCAVWLGLVLYVSVHPGARGAAV